MSGRNVIRSSTELSCEGKSFGRSVSSLFFSLLV